MNKNNIQSLWLSLSEAKSQQEFDKRFSLLFERIKQPLEFFFKVKCKKDHHDAQDLVMSTMGRILEKLHLYDPSNSAFSTWAFSIAYNLMLDGARKGRKRSTTFSINEPVITDEGEDMLHETILDDAMDPNDLLERKESHERLHASIDRLKPESKKVVTMFYLDQLKMVEIAEKLNMGLNNVKIVLMRARRKLAEIY